MTTSDLDPFTYVHMDGYMHGWGHTHTYTYTGGGETEISFSQNYSVNLPTKLILLYFLLIQRKDKSS